MLGNTFTDGNQALVVLVAKQLCLTVKVTTTTTTCLSNDNPSEDLPTSDSGFQSALQIAFNSSTAALTACVQVAGEWYVELTAGGGANTGATGTGPTGTGVTGTGTTGTGTTGTGTTGTGVTG
jgi:hypothetical protein